MGAVSLEPIVALAGGWAPLARVQIGACFLIPPFFAAPVAVIMAAFNLAELRVALRTMWRTCYSLCGRWPMLNLPALTADDEFETVHDKGTIEIKGIRPCLRCVAPMLLCLPRLAEMAFLAFVGCQYLAQTASLSDIVLNAVALAFVLDVDELVANVLLTKQLRGLLPRTAPSSCGITRSAFAQVKDIIRYIITVAAILFALFCWLVPFSQNVEVAAMRSAEATRTSATLGALLPVCWHLWWRGCSASRRTGSSCLGRGPLRRTSYPSAPKPFVITYSSSETYRKLLAWPPLTCSTPLNFRGGWTETAKRTLSQATLAPL